MMIHMLCRCGTGRLKLANAQSRGVEALILGGGGIERQAERAYSTFAEGGGDGMQMRDLAVNA